eukprot:3220267-Pleurochrysis_carterae.AAC.1
MERASERASKEWSEVGKGKREGAVKGARVEGDGPHFFTSAAHLSAEAKRVKHEVDRHGQHEKVRVLAQHRCAARVAAVARHLPVGLARSEENGAACCGKGAADLLRDVARRDPPRARGHLASLERRHHLLDLGQVGLAPVEPLAKLGLVDAAVEEHDETQAAGSESLDETLHRQDENLGGGIAMRAEKRMSEALTRGGAVRRKARAKCKSYMATSSAITLKTQEQLVPLTWTVPGS